MKALIFILPAILCCIASQAQTWTTKCQSFKIENSKWSPCSPVDINITYDKDKHTIKINKTRYDIKDTQPVGDGTIRFRAEYDSRLFTITMNIQASTIIIFENKSPLMMVNYQLK